MTWFYHSLKKFTRTTIFSIELWYYIMQEYHINVKNKHLLSTATYNAIRTKWTTNIMVRGIYNSYITIFKFLHNL